MERLLGLNRVSTRALVFVGVLGLLVGLAVAFGASAAHAYPGSGSTAQECLLCHKGDPGAWGGAVNLYAEAHDSAVGECATCHTTEDESIHGRWGDTPEACARCHRTHSAVEEDLLAMGKDELCVFCHGSSAGLAQTNVLDGILRLDLSPLRGGGFQQVRMNTSTNAGNSSDGEWMFPVSGEALVSVTSRHSLGVEATVWGSWNAEGYSAAPNAGDTNAILECVSCHDPHSYGMTYRMLTRRPVGSGVAKHPGNESVEWEQRVFVTDQLTYARWNPQSDILAYTTQDYSNTEIGNKTWAGGEWVVARQQGTSYAAPDVLDPDTGEVLDVSHFLGLAPMYSQQISQWCASCHDRYNALQSGHSGPGSSDTGDAIFGYRHKTGDAPPVWDEGDGRYESDSCGYGCHSSRQLNCLGCHVAHGSSAGMTPMVTALPWPGQGGGQYDQLGNGTHLGEGWLAQDSRLEYMGGSDYDGESRSTLLRLDNRGICQNPACHPKGNEAYLEPYDEIDDACVECHQYSNPHDGIGSTECSACHTEGVSGDCTACHAATVSEWGGTGHGRTSGAYAASGNPAADFTGAANGESACLFCHDDAVPHGTATNPFRLANTDTLQNDNCLICHESSSTGYDPDGAGAMALKSAVVRVDSSHYGVKHSAGNNGGQFCWDCHDPHGDQNAAMIHDQVSKTSTTNYGTPVTTVATTFVTMGSWGSYVNDIAFDGICQVCHTSTVRYTGSTNYDATHNTGAGCTTCHPHDTGFAPAGGDCTSCHASPQDNGDGVPVGGRRAVVGEFAMASRHVQGASIDAADCVACHDMAQHQQGYVRLKDADDPANPAAVVTLTGDPRADSTEAAKLEPFCLSCHDGDGAGGAAPFSDGATPAAIDAPAWSSASHSSGPMTCFGDGETFGCHSTGHGSAKVNLLAPEDLSQPPVPGDAWREEEGMCYTCHDVDGPAATNIASQFSLNSRHNVSSLDQVDGSSVECADCHNPHTASSASPLANPDSSVSAPWSGTGEDFCLTCHDGAPPAGVAFAGSGGGTGYDKSAYGGTTHEYLLGPDSCRSCHVEHGSSYDSLLKDEYIMADYNAYSAGDGDYALCWTCHDENDTVMQENAFRNRHDKHVRSESSPCAICHDTHAPADAGEEGLINFDPGIQMGYDNRYIDGYDASTSFWINGGADKGYCYLDCHNKDHKPKDYDRVNASTVDCTTCHPGGPP